MSKSNVFYNHGKTPIYISCKIQACPNGGPGTMESQILVVPGGGIDVEILNLKKSKPKRTTPGGAQGEDK